MPRKRRLPSKSGLYHFTARGVNKKRIFDRFTDFEFYKTLLKEYGQRLNVAIHHYCLMSNHVHLLLRADDTPILSRFGHFVSRRYAYYLCKKRGRTGQVFQKRFGSIPVEDENYLSECGRYIERNPLKAKLVHRIEEYLWSSYPFYAYGKPDELITPSHFFLGLHRSAKKRKQMYRRYIETPRPYDELIENSLLPANVSLPDGVR